MWRRVYFGVISGVILVFGLIMRGQAALTQAQLQQHIGAMMNRGIAQTMRSGAGLEDVKLVDVMGWAAVYGANGSVGTLA